jgi:phosphoglycolate phosphatase
VARRFSAIAFDFDYTLADSSTGVVECVRFALDRLGLPSVSADRVRRTIGLSLPDTFLALVGRHDRHKSAEFGRLFVQRADVVMIDRTVVSGPVGRTVRRLRKGGLRLAIVSTKFRRRITAILQREGLLDSFQAIVGGEDVLKQKPAPEGLLNVIASLGVSAGQCLYVGDSVTDAEAARRASVLFVVVLSGVTPRHSFRRYEPYAVLDKLSDLPRLVGC